MKKNKNKNNKNKKKRAPDPPGYLRPNSFVPRAPKGTHAGEGSLASEKVSLPIYSIVWAFTSRPLFARTSADLPLLKFHVLVRKQCTSNIRLCWLHCYSLLSFSSRISKICMFIILQMSAKWREWEYAYDVSEIHQDLTFFLSSMMI